MANSLLLLDVDGTLLDTKGAGVSPFKDAISLVSGTAVEFDRENNRGKTDHMIARSFLHGEAALDDAEIEKVLRLYESGLRKALQVQPAAAYSGVIEVLEYLQSHPDVEVVAATGNTELGLRLKLESAKLDKLLVKHYCSTSSDLKRSQILLRAKNDFPEVKRFIVVGDTQHDAIAAQEIGSRFAAVTSHYYGESNAKEDLADYLVPHPWSIDMFQELI